MLVRLNPNIPWKTRGNGAICIHFGKGQTTKSAIGEVNGETCFAFQRTPEAASTAESGIDTDRVLERIEAIINKNSDLTDKNTNPGIVILEFHKTITEVVYWLTVREVVNLDYIKSILDKIQAVYKGYKNSRGLIGAAAAISWAVNLSLTASYDRTYELLAYRERARWGTPREIDESSVIEMDTKFESTFDNYDYENRHINIAPNSPCPVLFGIRGDNHEVLPTAQSAITSENIDEWLIFETNQGTDDHLQSKPLSEVEPYQSVITEGKIISEPMTIVGGHVIFTLGSIEEERREAANDSLSSRESRIRGQGLGVGGQGSSRPQYSRNPNFGNPEGIFNARQLDEVSCRSPEPRTSSTASYVDCAAYEPTKGFREVINRLKTGDSVRIYGSVRAEPFTINIEKLEIVKLVDKYEKIGNPKCPECGKSMKSVGKGQGYRCRACGQKADEDHAEYKKLERGVVEGLYEVPVCARRHLSKPLKRIKRK